MDDACGRVGSGKGKRNVGPLAPPWALRACTVTSTSPTCWFPLSSHVPFTSLSMSSSLKA